MAREGLVKNWWKILVMSLVAVLAFKWFLTSEKEEQKVHKEQIVTQLPAYSFQDNGSTIFAHGTWASDVEGGLPIQVTQLDCFQEKSECVEMCAILALGVLSVDSNHWLVRQWNQDEITFEPISSTCIRTTLHIDRVGKTVTSERTTIQPKPPGCGLFSDQSLIFHLENGPVLPLKKR